MNFPTAAYTCFAKTFDYTGRASRSEYWWFFLLILVVHLAVDVIEGDNRGSLFILFSLIFFFPWVSVICRRLHDIGKSGWWQIAFFIGQWFGGYIGYEIGGVGFAFTIVFIVMTIWVFWLCRPSDPGSNKYGESPHVTNPSIAVVSEESNKSKTPDSSSKRLGDSEIDEADKDDSVEQRIPDTTKGIGRISEHSEVETTKPGKDIEQNVPETTRSPSIIQNTSEAVENWRKKAKQGDATAQFNLGLMYQKGDGVAQDYAETAKWYRRSAEQGYVKAQFNLGLMYSSGEGVPQHGAEAVNWYRLAAEQGDTKASLKLGNLYFKGEGIDRDYTKAAVWYRHAAERGNNEAQCKLGVMYSDGIGFWKNHRKAYVWFAVAAASGHKEAAKRRDTAAKKLFRAKLSAAQAEAVKLHKEIQFKIDNSK